MANKLTVQIDYSHVLSEISVNRKDPCEVIRELISNSYDADAKNICYFPLLREEGFIFFDDGCGLSLDRDDNDITPYEAFFSIGKSTKLKGSESVGYKCQGSKLCFASSRIVIITRCNDEELWRFKEVSDPRRTIGPGYNLEADSVSDPSLRLRNAFFNPDQRTRKTINHFNEKFFQTNFSSGTLIIVFGLNVESFEEYYGLDNKGRLEYSYLYNYIRFYTKHGDTRIVNESQGFKREHSTSLANVSNLKGQCKLWLWYDESLLEVPIGFPYLKKPDKSTLAEIASPLKVSRLRAGRFFARHAKVVKVSGNQYSFIAAVDGNKRALEGYDSLDRQRKKISGMKLADQRGVFISAQGVKVCQYNSILEKPQLNNDFGVLTDTKAQSHYIIIIDGPFDLVTSRNSLSNESIKVLNSQIFVDQFKSFLLEFKSVDTTFRELCDVLNKQRVDEKRESQISYRDELKVGLKERERFRITGISYLTQHTFVVPESNEEHWVGALYSTLGHFVEEDSEFSKFWLQPLTFSSRGIDSAGHLLKKPSLRESDISTIEYKYRFDNVDFNHPLFITDYIVCWEMFPAEDGSKIVDEYECFGFIKIEEDERLRNLTYTIEGIESMEGNLYGNSIKVICLKELIKMTFDARFTSPS